MTKLARCVFAKLKKRNELICLYGLLFISAGKYENSDRMEDAL